nr:MAG TPA: hypothetical protein [Inoviridae sp.]
MSHCAARTITTVGRSSTSCLVSYFYIIQFQ